MHRIVIVGLLTVALVGCASYRTAKQADHLIEKGNYPEGIRLLRGLAEESPKDYRMRYLRARDNATQQLLQQARQAILDEKVDVAASLYRQVLAYDPEQVEARRGLALIDQGKRQSDWLTKAAASHQAGDAESAMQFLSLILTENPQNVPARQLRQTIELQRQRDDLMEPQLRSSFKKPVSLEFRNASVQAIFEVLSRSSGINFIFDKDVKSDSKTTIYAKETTVEDALQLILKTNQLGYKALNDSTLLVYPATGDKEKQYEDLVVRAFYLGNTEPKKVQDMVRALVAPKSMYVDDNLRMLVVRDTLAVIDTVERLVSVYDLAEPEVTLEVEIMEVSDDSLLNLGITYPSSVSLSASGAAGKAGQLTMDELVHLNRGNFTAYVPDPFAVLNLKQTSGKANLLANPKIRVRSREKAKVLIGDKVPVITTTTNQTSGSTSESVSYLDVGLKLEVEPEVHVNNDVSINVGLEVSNIVKEVKSTTGLLTYQIGTRNASTVLRLRDGETQMLAGLIKDEQRESASHVPGLGKLPVLGKLFSSEVDNKSKTEIVLLITPHVVRSLATPSVNSMAFASGTGSKATTRPLRLGAVAQYSSVNEKMILPDAEKVSPDLSGATSSPVADLTVPNVPSSSVTKIEVVAPGKISPDQEFTAVIMMHGQGFSELGLELLFDRPGIELVQAKPVAKMVDFDAGVESGVLKINMADADPYSGPLCMLTLRLSSSAAETLTMTARAGKAVSIDKKPLTLALPEPQLVKIVP